MHPPPPPPPHPHTSSPQGGEGGAKGGKRACTVQSCNQLSKKCSIYAVQSLYLTYSTLLLYIHIHRNRLCSFEGELGSKSTSLLCGAVLRSTSCFHYGVPICLPTRNREPIHFHTSTACKLTRWYPQAERLATPPLLPPTTTTASTSSPTG